MLKRNALTLVGGGSISLPLNARWAVPLRGNVESATPSQHQYAEGNSRDLCTSPISRFVANGRSSTLQLIASLSSKRRQSFRRDPPEAAPVNKGGTTAAADAKKKESSNV